MWENATLADYALKWGRVSRPAPFGLGRNACPTVQETACSPDQPLVHFSGASSGLLAAPRRSKEISGDDSLSKSNETSPVSIDGRPPGYRLRCAAVGRLS